MNAVAPPPLRGLQHPAGDAAVAGVLVTLGEGEWTAFARPDATGMDRTALLDALASMPGFRAAFQGVAYYGSTVTVLADASPLGLAAAPAVAWRPLTAMLTLGRLASDMGWGGMFLYVRVALPTLAGSNLRVGARGEGGE